LGSDSEGGSSTGFSEGGGSSTGSGDGSSVGVGGAGGILGTGVGPGGVAGASGMLVSNLLSFAARLVDMPTLSTSPKTPGMHCCSEPVRVFAGTRYQRPSCR